MSKWPFQPLAFEEKTPDQMLAAAKAFYDQIKQRRTVRQFSDRPVAKEIIENAIRAAGTAPSGANMIIVAGYPEENAEVPVISKLPLSGIATFKE